MGLLEKLQSALPLYAKSASHLTKLIRKKGLRIQPDQELKISNVYDSGEMGGIVDPRLEWVGMIHVPVAAVKSIRTAVWFRGDGQLCKI